MSNRIRIAVAVATVVTAASMVAGAPAHAEDSTPASQRAASTWDAPHVVGAGDPLADHQPCVATREWNGLYQQTKPALEKRWEVEGLGIEVILPFGLVHEVVVYPRCGYTMDVAWYGITYKRRGKHLWAVWATQCENWNTGTSCLVGV